MQNESVSGARTVRTRPRRPKGRVRRPQILATAVELLREQGLWSVRVSDVAKRAGTSPASVIYYFGTKDQLFEAAITDADAAFYARLWPELEELETAVERVACVIVRSSASDWVLWMDLWVYARRHPEMLAVETAFHQRWRSTIAEVVRYGQARGEFGRADSEDVATRLAALTDGLAVHMVLEEPGRTAEHYVQMSLAAAAAELGCDLRALRRAAARVPAEPPSGASAR